MAEIINGGSRTTYYQIDKNGKMYRLAKNDEFNGVYEHEKTEGKNIGKVERRKTISALQGFVEDFFIISTDYGDQFRLVIADVDGSYTLSIPTDSSYYENLRSKIPNLKVGQMYQFASYKMQKKDLKGNIIQDKYVYGISVQTVPDLAKVEPFYNRENIETICKIDREKLDRIGSEYWKGYYRDVAIEYKFSIIPKERERFMNQPANEANFRQANLAEREQPQHEPSPRDVPFPALADAPVEQPEDDLPF